MTILNFGKNFKYRYTMSEIFCPDNRGNAFRNGVSRRTSRFGFRNVDTLCRGVAK